MVFDSEKRLADACKQFENFYLDNSLRCSKAVRLLHQQQQQQQQQEQQQQQQKWPQEKQEKTQERYEQSGAAAADTAAADAAAAAKGIAAEAPPAATAAAAAAAAAEGDEEAWLVQELQLAANAFKRVQQQLPDLLLPMHLFEANVSPEGLESEEEEVNNYNPEDI